MAFNPAHRIRPASLISDDTPNALGAGSDGGLRVQPVDPADLISTDTPNALEIGADGKLVATGGGGGTGTVRFTFTAAPATVEASISAPITVPYDWTVIGWRMFDGTGGTGVATVDWLLLDHLGDTGVSITAAATPHLSGSHAESTTLTGWTTTGSAGQLLQAVLTGVTGFREVTCELLLAKG